MKMRILLVLLLLGVIVLTPGVALAQSIDCDSLVVDGAGVFGPGIDQVKSKANELEKLGADPRIRTIQTFGSSGNLDNYVQHMQDQCPSWRAPDGGRKNNLVVLIVAVSDRKTGLYYGDQWSQALDSSWTAIQADRMNPRFRDGDFADGFVAGLTEMTRLIDLQVHPQAYPVVVQQPAPQQPPQVVVVQQPAQPQSPPPDYKGLWQVLGWLLVIVAAFVALFFVWRLISRLLTEQAKRRAAQQKASVAKQAAAGRIVNWDTEYARVEALLNQLSGQVKESELEALRQKLARADELNSNASIAYNDADQSAGDPGRPGLTVDEYQVVEQTFEEVLETLRQAEQLLREVEGRVNELEALRQSTPKACEAAIVSIANARKAVEDIRSQGFKVETFVAELDRADRLSDAAKSSLEWHDFESAQASAGNAISAAEQVIDDCNSLPQRLQAIQDNIAKLAGSIESAIASIEVGRTAFDRIAAEFAEVCWAPIRGNGTESQNRVRSAEQLMQQAQNLSSMDTQDWSGAEQALASADALLVEVGSLMRSIAALETSLQAAKRDASDEVESAQEDIDKASAYIKKYDDDIREQLEHELEAVQRQLDEARRELQELKPDYLKVVKLARNANETADKTLAAARSEHEAAERLRKQAVAAVRDAKAAVSKAAEYIEDHARDVGFTAKKYLEDARQFLAQAQSARDLSQVVRFAGEAEERADSAYARAVSDFEDAEDARRPTYTPSYSGWGSSSSSDDDSGSSGFPTISFPTTHSSGHSSGGGSSHHSGGGSTSWGHSGGGGGSTGWSAPSRGGGGSTGW